MPEKITNVSDKKSTWSGSGSTTNTKEDTKARNLATYGNSVKKFRLRAHMTAEELAERLNIAKSSVRNWECGLSRPDPEYLYRMFTILNVEPNEFFDFQARGRRLTDDEAHLLDQFRRLDRNSQDSLIVFADAMCTQLHKRILQANYEKIDQRPYLEHVVAAGDGEDWSDYGHREPEMVLLYTCREVRLADEIMKVNGMSMEPQYHDGDLVLVQYRKQLKNGDIGIFYVPGRGGVIKQVAYDRLHSLNKEYDDIFPYEDGAKIIGRVVGIVTDDMYPTQDECKLYQEAIEVMNTKK